MPPKKYVVTLTAEERSYLQGLVSKGKAAAYKQIHARILLKADTCAEGWKDQRIAEALDVGRCTVERVRQRFVEEGLEAALNRKKQTKRIEKILDGAKEAQLIALACSQAPEGRNRWTLQLLAEELVALKIVEEISYETVRRTLKKTSLSPG